MKSIDRKLRNYTAGIAGRKPYILHANDPNIKNKVNHWGKNNVGNSITWRRNQ